MAFRKAAKSRTKVANPARKRRKHRAAKAANPHRASRRKRNGYAAASHMANPTRKRRRKAVRSTKRRRNPEVAGFKLDGMTIAMAVGAGASTALVSSLIEKSGGLEKLGIESEANRKIAAAASSAIIGAAGAYFFRGKPKVKKFFMFHAVISGGVAVFAAAKAKTDELATKILPGNTQGMYLPSPNNGMGLLQADMQGMYLPAPKGNTGLIQQDVGKAPARTFGK